MAVSRLQNSGICPVLGVNIAKQIEPAAALGNIFAVRHSPQQIIYKRYRLSTGNLGFSLKAAVAACARMGISLYPTVKRRLLNVVRRPIAAGYIVEIVCSSIFSVGYVLFSVSFCSCRLR